MNIAIKSNEWSNADYMDEGEMIAEVDYNKLPRTIICDLDGTISLLNGRDPYKPETCNDDKVNETVAYICNLFGKFVLHDDLGERITFLSGREDKYKPQTIEFLNRALDADIIAINNYNLFMRKTGDFRKDSIVKKELYDNHVKDKYITLFVMDDRNQVVDMWRNELKLTCFQVAEGNF